MRFAIVPVVLCAVLAMAPTARCEPLQLAQRTAPIEPIPGGLPGRSPAPSMPAPAMPPPMTPRIESAPPLQVIPPPPAPAARVPDGGPDSCDCYAAVDVPLYENGKVVGSRREQRLTGRSPQCCRR